MTAHPSLAQALDELVQAAAEATDDRWTLAALARAVTELEGAAGASLGGTEHDQLVVLQRRLGRVHGQLLCASTTMDPAIVLSHLRALRAPAPEPASGPVAPLPRKPRVGEPA